MTLFRHLFCLFNFLNVTISINKNRFGFDWYRKPIFSGRFLNFYSNHPIAQKRGTIFSLIDRTILLSDVRFHTQNLTFIINILLDNDYPLSFIFDTINLRIKNLIKNRHITHKNSTWSRALSARSEYWRSYARSCFFLFFFMIFFLINNVINERITLNKFFIKL
ncbi:hypothetical protein ALC56_07511 [Trachymyrmex septentrionalis]|uniref:Helix-turn-helix domain-containing protein n=1 Tax=Trachymyrmex septentrionalis TaxID=34720 RepID=A0A195FCJ0_9HYME|nr:hypothetical protein ALC56_07511 [Trachymyrmex septentrionalis]